MATSGTAGGRGVSGGRLARYREDELVVGLPYEAIVLRRLERWGALPALDPADRDPRLGLGRVRLDAAAATRHLEREHPGWVERARGAARAEGYEASPLDLVVRCLREHFRSAYAGWVPTFAKNRILERRVAGSYVIDGGGDGGPTPVPDYVLDTAGGGDGPDLLRVGARELAPGSGVRVGVVDTRLAPHPWLAGSYVASAADIRSGHADAPRPWTSDHATFVSGLVLRQAPGAVVVLRAGLDDDARQDSWTVARVVAELAASSVDIVNLSFGCATDDGRPPLVLSAALAALGPRTLAVAAAGNHGYAHDGHGPAPSWPAALENVVAVGALDGAVPAEFSPVSPWVDAFAPGVGVTSTCDPGRAGGAVFARWSGTSFAAATVAGALAARVGPGVGPVQAWEEIRSTSVLDAHGRPLIAPTTPKDWPPDEPTDGG